MVQFQLNEKIRTRDMQVSTSCSSQGVMHSWVFIPSFEIMYLYLSMCFLNVVIVLSTTTSSKNIPHIHDPLSERFSLRFLLYLSHPHLNLCPLALGSATLGKGFCEFIFIVRVQCYIQQKQIDTTS